MPRDRERAESRRPIAPGEVADLERLGELLRAMRVEAGLTRRHLADAAELSAQQLRRIEHGTRRTRTSTLDRIADALADRLDTDADDLADDLAAAAGDTLASESDYRERVDARRERRHRVTHVEVGPWRFPAGQPITMSGPQAEAFRRYIDGARRVKVGRTLRYVRDDDA